MKEQLTHAQQDTRDTAFLAALRAAPRFNGIATMPEVSRRLREIHCEFFPHLIPMFAELPLLQ